MQFSCDRRREQGLDRPAPQAAYEEVAGHCPAGANRMVLMIADPTSLDDADLPQAGLALGRLTSLFGFHLRMAQVAIYRDFAAALADLGLTQKQCAVMELIAANPGASQIDLAATLGTDRATMMALVDRLDDRGLLTRSRSAVDRRRQELRLTELGTATLTETRRRIDAHEQRFLTRFSAQEVETLVACLKRLYQGGGEA